MTGIDWSKAPEGHDFHINWSEVSKVIQSGFYRKEGDRYVKEDGDYTTTNDVIRMGLKVTKRPAWNGKDGSLPPVGTVCQVHRNGTEWVEVEVIAHFRNSAAMVAAFIPTADGEKHVSQAIADCFRPIRTAEQIKDQEAEKATKELERFLTASRGLENNEYFLAKLLYHAGYRKQVQP